MRQNLAAMTAILLVLALPAGARAQSPELGFRFGWSRSGFGGDPVVERTALNGLSGAASLTVHLTPAFALQPELLLLRKGAAHTSSFLGVANGDTITGSNTMPLGLYYLEVPILARFTLPTGPGGIRPYLAAGPYVAHLLHCASDVVFTVDAMGGGVGDTVSVGDACLTGGVRHDDVGATAAAGFRWPLGRRLSAALDARYELGWRSVVASPGAVHNRALELTAGISLPLDR